MFFGPLEGNYLSLVVSKLGYDLGFPFFGPDPDVAVVATDYHVGAVRRLLPGGEHNLLIRLQHFAEAEKLLQEVMRHNQIMEKAYVVLGKLYNAQKQYTQSERVLRRAIELDPDNSDAHWFLAAALQHLGRREEAQRQGAIVAQKKEALRERDHRLREVLTPLSTDPGKE